MSARTIICLCLVVAVTALPKPPQPAADECSLEGGERFDCHPEPNDTPEACLARGCCYVPRDKLPLPNVPWCFFPSNFGGYRYVNVTNTADGQVAFLERTFESAYPKDVAVVRIDVEHQTDTRLRIKISDAGNNRYETPYPKLRTSPPGSVADPHYQVDINTTSVGFVVRRNTGEVIFNTLNLGAFIFADQFLQISSRYSGQMYGLGEHRSTLALDHNWSRYTMFNFGPAPQENVNLYGSHPFYMVVEPNGVSHGVYLHNSNAMDVLLQPLDAVTFRTIGGVLDFYFFMGPSPADVITQYTDLIGRAFFPPYWSLGFHLCKYGYNSDNKTREVWQRTRDAGIPFDVQWNDIDMMINQNDFTIDPERFPNIGELVQDIHDAGMKYVVILDPGVSASEPQGTYPPYDDGIVMDVFVKDQNGSVFVGKVWNPVSTVFVDFTHPRAVEYWTKQSRDLHQRLPYDGLWIDMNEPSNFLDGTSDGCPDSELEHPKYYTGVTGDLLARSTLCMTAQHYAGRHYDVHNIYGIAEAEATNLAVRDILGKRPFVLSRSTFAGSGAYTGHWSGDNWSNWYDLGKSVFEILSSSLFGMSLSGADICGHNGDVDPAVCSRWHQLGAFYSFSRNHNSLGGSEQDPVALGQLVVDSARKALTARYTLLPYLYTLMYRASVFGETVARPLFFEFPTDTKTHLIDKAFLWGPGLYIVPVVEDSTNVTAYLPAGVWYDWYSGSQRSSQGEEVLLDAPLDTIPLLVRGGHILPTQAPAVTTTLSRKNGFTLLVASGADGKATGSLFWDDGDTTDTIENNLFGTVTFELNNQTVKGSVEVWNTEDIPRWEAVKVLGVRGEVTAVRVDGQTAEFTFSNGVLLVTRLNIPLNKNFEVSWS